MKTVMYVLMSVVAIMASVLVACEKKNTPEVSRVDSNSRYRIDVIARKPVTIEGSELVIPVGSRIQVAKDDYSVKVTLPDEYGFLVEQADSTGISQRTLPVYPFATYSCVCSGKGSSCQVFYQEQAGGFGCLHQSCSGSCTGSFVAEKFEQVIAIIRLDYKDISIPKAFPFTPASLRTGAKKQFFSIPEVQQKIREQYELMYRFTAKPDFKSINPQQQSLRDYVLVRAQVYGVDFYMLGPAEFSKRTDLFEVYTTKASCTCGTAANGCTMDSGGFLGWRVYYCSGGCNGCQLTITKETSPGIHLPGNKPPIQPVIRPLVKN